MQKSKYTWFDVLWVWLMCAFLVFLFSEPMSEAKFYHDLARVLRRCAYELGKRAIAAESAYWQAMERVRP